MSNVYYSPENYGFEKIDELEYSTGGYEYDTRVVWRELATGELYTARDSGCSCPIPFDGMTCAEDLTLITEGVIADLEQEVASERAIGLQERVDFIDKIKRLYRNPVK